MTSRHARLRRLKPRHALGLKDRPVLRAIAFILLGIFTFSLTGLTSAYVILEGNLQKYDVTEFLPEENRPTAEPEDPDDPHAGKALNILIIGSDVRDGENAKLGGQVEGMRSDTTMVMHIAADRSRAEIVSIPRDSMVSIPSCKLEDGSWTHPQGMAMFNSAFAIGGDSGNVNAAAACTWQTVEQNTGVRIDDYVVLDFKSVVTTVDALGGVPMCIKEDIDSPKAHLKLSAGMQTLDGKQALGYARARTGKGLGNGSDINRIERQKQLMGAMVRHILSKNLLTDSPALYRVLDAVTESLSVSQGLDSIPGLIGLASSFQDVPAKNVMFYTVPWTEYPQDPNRVIWTEDAQLLWDAIAADRPIMEIEDGDSDLGDGTSADDGSGEGDADSGAGAESGSDSESAGDSGSEGGGSSESSSSQIPSGDAWNPLSGADEEDACG